MDDKGHDLVVYYHPTSGKEADAQDWRTWGSCRQAVQACERGEYDGVAYVFVPEDPIIGPLAASCPLPPLLKVGFWFNKAAVGSIRLTS